MLIGKGWSWSQSRCISIQGWDEALVSQNHVSVLFSKRVIGSAAMAAIFMYQLWAVAYRTSCIRLGNNLHGQLPMYLEI